jgi:Domain of unknown function (DUF3576)
MILHQLARTVMATGLVFSLSSCGDRGLFSRESSLTPEQQAEREERAAARRDGKSNIESQTSLAELFAKSADPNTTVEVNKYIWQASLEVLNFLPIEAVDPFTGVFTTGYGRPPGGGRAYRATVYVQDPALDARSLKIALQGQGGGSVAPETVRAVEDAILTRARQLRVRDSRL